MALFKKIALTTSFILILWLGGYMWFAINSITMPAERPDEITDAIVVLTGGQDRIETGLRLFANGRTKHLFISGVHPGVTKKEITKKWSGETALPPCCLTLGHDARSTVQNADETRAWLAGKNYTSLRLITANFHMVRAMNEFKKALPDAEIIPHPIVQPKFESQKIRFWTMAFIEYHKTIFRWPLLLLSIRKPELESLPS